MFSVSNRSLIASYIKGLHLYSWMIILNRIKFYFSVKRLKLRDLCFVLIERELGAFLLFTDYMLHQLIVEQFDLQERAPI